MIHQSQSSHQIHQGNYEGEQSTNSRLQFSSIPKPSWYELIPFLKKQWTIISVSTGELGSMWEFLVTVRMSSLVKESSGWLSPCQVVDGKKDITGKQPTADQRHIPHSISSCFQLKSLEISKWNSARKQLLCITREKAKHQHRLRSLQHLATTYCRVGGLALGSSISAGWRGEQLWKMCATEAVSDKLNHR